MIISMRQIKGGKNIMSNKQMPKEMEERIEQIINVIERRSED